jgi:hypothetical protein
MRVDARSAVGTCDVLLMTFDTLRFDVASKALLEGLTPNLASILPADGWELRHSPGSFTWSAHQSFFAGFLPTPAAQGPHPRLFALEFAGSETVDEQTCVLDAPDIVSGLRALGYHAICIGGVGFFSKQNAISRTLPALFDESHWSPELGVTNERSTELQVRLACERLEAAGDRRVFLFINVSALHQPNNIYVPAGDRPAQDSAATQKAALAYVDAQLPPLFAAMRLRGRWLAVLTSDHGTAYGEDGYRGHRLAHEVVWNVPYAELIL